MSSSTFVLRGYWRSSATWRVRIALHLKGIEYDYVPVHLIEDGGQQHSDEHKALNPLGQVPVLQHDGHNLSQSLAIIDYLEQHTPEPRLYPEALPDRAKAIQLAEMVNAGIQPLQNLSVLQRLVREHGLTREQMASEWAGYWIDRGLHAMERVAQQTAGQYCVGDTPTVADICLIPQLYNARRFELDVEASYPTLARIEKACEAQEPFQTARPEAMSDAQP